MRHRRLAVLALSLLLASITAPAQAGLLGLLGTAPVATPSSATRWNVFGRPCSLIAVPTASPLAAGTCPGVRPGAVLRMAGGGQCTFNFMFRGSDGDTYMGTAGHCALGVEGSAETSWDEGEGPPVLDGQGNLIGEFAYAVVDDPRDFALIRLADGVTASPEMCHFGGPTGVDTTRSGLLGPTLLQHYGQGSVVGQVVPGRTLLALSTADPDFLAAAGVALPGDSGSGVTTTDGRAVGVVVTTGIHLGVLDTGTVGITRLAPQVARAEQVTGVDYTLQTAPTR